MATHAVIVSVGNELTSGQTVDTNSAYLAQRLAELGIPTLAHHTVEDNQDRIAAILTPAAGEAPLVVVSGGLGPTADDLTRQALAQALGDALVTDEAALAEIAAFFAARGRQMNETNRIQACRPERAELLRNEVGTAPGLYARLGGAEVFVVPGVPSEMRWMVDAHVLPRVRVLAGDSRIVFRTVHAFGTGESDIGARLADLMRRDANPLVGTTASSGIISVRITARGEDPEQARALAERSAEEVWRRLDGWAFGDDEQSMADVVGEALVQRGQTVCVAESCTGGLLGEMLTRRSGSSAYFLGGVLAYANAVKAGALDVPAELLERCGAVSAEVAEAMAVGVRRWIGGDYGLAITGIAGPTGGSADKPVGLVYTALAGPDGVRAVRNVFPGDRGHVRLRSALTALNMLRLELRA